MTLLIILYELFCSNPIRANVLELKTLLAVSVGPQLRKICTIIFQLSFAVGRHPYFCNRPIGVYHTSSLLTLRLPMLSLSRAALFCAAGYLCLPDYSHFFGCATILMKTSFHKISVPLHKAVAYVLLKPQLCGVQCTFDQLIASLNYLGGGVGKDAYATVTCELMRKSFEKFGKGESTTT